MDPRLTSALLLVLCIVLLLAVYSMGLEIGKDLAISSISSGTG